MKNWKFEIGVVILTLAVALVIFLSEAPVEAQTGSVWTKPPETIALALDQDHTKLLSLVNFLPGRLTQAQIDQIEINLFPPPTRNEKLQALIRMKEFRDRLNLEDTTVPEFQNLTAAIDAAYDLVFAEPEEPLP